MTEYEALIELERRLIEQIEFIQRDYQKAIDPLVKKLADLRSFRPRTQIVSIAQANENEAIDKIIQGGDGE